MNLKLLIEMCDNDDNLNVVHSKNTLLPFTTLAVKIYATDANGTDKNDNRTLDIFGHHVTAPMDAVCQLMQQQNSLIKQLHNGAMFNQKYVSKIVKNM